MKLSIAACTLVLATTTTSTTTAAAAGNIRSGNNKEDKPLLDVAIIGAGTAGPYAGWRLLTDTTEGQEERPRNIEIFERQSHVGGRFYSPRIGCDDDTIDPKNAPRTELGGMRIRNIDKMVRGVCKELDIEVGPFYMNKATPNLGPFKKDGSTEARYDELCEMQYDEDKAHNCAGDEPTAPIYLGGLFTDRQSMNEKKTADMYYPSPNQNVSGFEGAIPYVVEPWNHASSVAMPTTGVSFQAGHSPLHHTDNDFRRRLAQEKTANPCDTNNAKKYFDTPGMFKTKLNDEIPAYQQSMWGMNSLNEISKEELALNDAISGYGGKLGGSSPLNLAEADATFTPNKSNGTVLPEQPTVSYTRPLMGMQEIPLSLEKAFRSEGGKTNLNSQLLKVEKHGDMDYELTFRRTWTSPCNQVTSFQGPEGSRAGELYTVKTKKVLITLTKSALQRVLFIDSTGKSQLADKVNMLTNALESSPALKYFASYDNRWWETKAHEQPGFPNKELFDVGRITSSANINNMFAWYPGTQDTSGVCPNQPEMGVIQNYITGFSDLTYAGMLNEELQLQCKETEADQCGKCFNEETGFVGPATNHAPKLLAESMRYEMAYVFGFDPATYSDHIP